MFFYIERTSLLDVVLCLTSLNFKLDKIFSDNSNQLQNPNSDATSVVGISSIGTKNLGHIAQIWLCGIRTKS